METFIIGHIYTFKEFSFTNTNGGTVMSNWKWNEKYEKPASFSIIKTWFDYETGNRAWGIPIDDEVKNYLKKNSKKGINVSTADEEPEFLFKNTYVVFLSEFDLI